MRKKSIKVVVDTNIFISFLISDTFYKLFPFLDSGKIRLLVSDDFLEEFIEVAKRPRFKKFYTDNDVTKLLSKINY